MRPIGKTLRLLCLLAAMFAGNEALAAVSASLDRERVALGDTLRLTLTATDDEDLDDADLGALRADFEILQRSTSSNISIVNGRRSQTRQLLLDITPRREGRLQIPPIRVGTGVTRSVPVVVRAAPDIDSDGETLLFEAEVDRDSVYVQGQVILTLRVQQAINLDDRSISELELEDAFVKPLEQQSFQRSIDGRPWLVHEVRYAIFPEHSGTLEIPPQMFSARIREGRRGFFALGGGGRLLRRTAPALSVEVLPRPDDLSGDTWLPARKLTLEERWSTPPEQLRAGESTTRTIRITGEGLQGAQLPPVMLEAVEGLKFYPDQPVIDEQEVASGLLGVRQDSAALVPTRAGSWSLPEIRVPWWDTETGAVRYAVLPGREITVAAADPVAGANLTAVPVPDIQVAGAVPTAAAEPGSDLAWKILSAVSTAGWLVTLVYLWRSRRTGDVRGKPSAEHTSERQAFKRLLDACAKNDAPGVRRAVLDWAAALSGKTASSLDQVADRFADEQLSAALYSLDASLYSPDPASWSGSDLAACLGRVRKHQRQSGAEDSHALELYPRAG